MRIHGLIIDPQRDFCDPETGTLYVAGAEKDMVRLAALIGRIGQRVEALHVTLDSHHTLHIAHPIWWEDPAGNPPAPFTILTAEDVAEGRWRAADPAARERSQKYVRQLAAHGRSPLCIWPHHCLIGTAGNAVMPALAGALADWEAARLRPVDYILKGSNVWTENYSAIQADVPDPADPSTQRNTRLLTTLDDADVVFIAGEASSHCVANTVRDIVAALGSDRGTAVQEKLVLLTDAMSPVPGFEGHADAFFAEMSALGIRTATTETFLAE